jgi:small-conductance mechanosensitive channel
VDGLVNSFKRFTILLTFLIIAGVSAIYIFDLFVVSPIDLPVFLTQAFRIIILLAFWLAIILFLRQVKPLIIKRAGTQVATVIQFLIDAMAVVVLIFGVLHTFGVSPTTLLTGAGIISITIGLVISTFVGDILAGALVFTTHRFKVGDNVIINNVPGKVTDMNALVTVIRTDVGQVSVPNNAIASGSVIITAIQKFDAKFESRLPYSVGDRVVTSYNKEEGIVKDITPLRTTVLLDSGKELTFLNNSVLSGSVAVAKITQTQKNE